MTEPTSMALSSNWLDSSGGAVANSNDLGVSFGTYQDSYPWWINRPTTYHYTYWKDWKISLTLTEVEHLRRLSRKDKKLRETLKKFTNYIEVKVDFPGDD